MYYGYTIEQVNELTYRQAFLFLDEGRKHQMEMMGIVPENKLSPDEKRKYISLAAKAGLPVPKG